MDFQQSCRENKKHKATAARRNEQRTPARCGEQQQQYIQYQGRTLRPICLSHASAAAFSTSTHGANKCSSAGKSATDLVQSRETTVPSLLVAWDICMPRRAQPVFLGFSWTPLHRMTTRPSCARTRALLAVPGARWRHYRTTTESPLGTVGLPTHVPAK